MSAVRSSKVLAGDLGATKTSLGLWQVEPGSDRGPTTLTLLHKRRYASAAHKGALEVIDHFLGDVGRPKAIARACLGVAGPVFGGRAVAPNLGWVVDAKTVASAFGIASADLVNDLVATAEGITERPESDFETLLAGEGVSSTRQCAAVVAAGTGLGMAILAPTRGNQWTSFPSEGGHIGLAPRDDQEIGFLRFLQRRIGRVSWERVVSGPGLVNLYEYLAEQQLPRALHVEALLERERAAAPTEISACGLRNGCPTCSAALTLFARFYGAVAGDLALCLMATGGVFLAGGVAPKILPALRSGVFAEGFLDKGRHRPLLERVPVRVVLDEDAALLGAARRAARALLDSDRVGADPSTS